MIVKNDGKVLALKRLRGRSEIVLVKQTRERYNLDKGAEAKGIGKI